MHNTYIRPPRLTFLDTYTKVLTKQERSSRDDLANFSTFMQNTYVTIICHNDELSLSSSMARYDCLQIDSKGFIVFSEINQILLKNYCDR